MKKIVKYRRDADELSEIVFRRRSRGDFVGALSIVHNEAAKSTDPEILAQTADIYTQMEMYDTAIIYWFKFMNAAGKDAYVEAYNSLGANFYLSGNDVVAGYYFNKQLENDNGEESFYEDILQEYLATVTNGRASYRLVYPENKSEREENLIEKAQKAIDEKNFDEVESLTEVIDEESAVYGKALVERAYAAFYKGDALKAQSLIVKAIELGEVNVRSLTAAINICAVNCETDVLDEYIQMLLDYEDDDEENYKKLNLLCNFGLTDDALEWAEKISYDIPYGANSNFLKGILLYNKGFFREAEIAFRHAYIVTLSPVAKYYREIAFKALNGDIKYKKLSVSFDLPEDEIERRLVVIKQLFTADRDNSLLSYPEDMEDIASWIFTGNNQTMQVATSIILASSKKGELIKLLDDYLVNPTLSDEVKHRMVSVMCEYGCYGLKGVVYGNLFKKVRIKEVAFEGDKANLFRKAYAYAFGRISVIEDNKRLLKLEKSALELQSAVVGKGRGDMLAENSIAPLACAIFINSSLGSFRSSGYEYKFFDVKKESVDKILKIAFGENKEE